MVQASSATVPPVPARSRRRRLSGRLSGAPSALIALMAVMIVLGVAWALLVPPFQAPDETMHFAYAQSLATRLALPGDPARPLGISTDQSLADGAVRAAALAFHPGSMRPQWSGSAFRQYLAAAARHPSQSDGGGPNPQAVNPPLFYLYSDLAYWVDGSDNLFGRLYAMRVWGVSLLLVNVLAAWLLAGEVFASRRLPQLICAAVCGLVPMETFIATSITPDALMVPLWTLALWLGTRLIRRAFRAPEALALCAVTAAAILTKATSYALVPAVLAALAFAWLRRPVDERRALRRRAAAALATLAAPVLAWVAYTKVNGRSPVNTVQAAGGGAPAQSFHVGQFLSYIWQFYLPRLSFMSRVDTGPRLAVYHVWLKEGWATFGWLDVPLPAWTYTLLGALTALVGVASAALLVARRRLERLAPLAFYALALGTLLFGLHLTAYRSLLAGQGPLLQGRYLLPAIGLFGLAVALVVSRAPPRWRGAAAGAVLAGLLLLQILSLATIAKVYYS